MGVLTCGDSSILPDNREKHEPGQLHAKPGGDKPCEDLERFGKMAQRLCRCKACLIAGGLDFEVPACVVVDLNVGDEGTLNIFAHVFRLGVMSVPHGKYQ